MKSHSTTVKVRYAETDQMGVVHHGNYAQYLEIGRLEWLEQFDISYRRMEEEGIMLPVYSMEIKYIKPARFDDSLKIETRLRQTPGVKIEFLYTIFNAEEEVISTASTVLVFMDKNSRRPVRCPEYILNKIKD